MESNYHSIETEHVIIVELADDDAPAGEDVDTVSGLKARRERMSTGEGARAGQQGTARHGMSRYDIL